MAHRFKLAVFPKAQVTEFLLEVMMDVLFSQSWLDAKASEGLSNLEGLIWFDKVMRNPNHSNSAMLPRMIDPYRKAKGYQIVQQDGNI